MKRLKKDCPCQKCCVWRSEREMAKLNLKIAEAQKAMIKIIAREYEPALTGLTHGGPLVCEPTLLTIGGKK